MSEVEHRRRNRENGDDATVKLAIRSGRRETEGKNNKPKSALKSTRNTSPARAETTTTSSSTRLPSDTKKPTAPDVPTPQPRSAMKKRTSTGKAAEAPVDPKLTSEPAPGIRRRTTVQWKDNDSDSNSTAKPGKLSAKEHLGGGLYITGSKLDSDDEKNISKARREWKRNLGQEVEPEPSSDGESSSSSSDSGRDQKDKRRASSRAEKPLGTRTPAKVGTTAKKTHAKRKGEN